MVRNNSTGLILHIVIIIAVYILSGFVLNATHSFVAQICMQLFFLWIGIAAYVLAGRYVLRNTESRLKDLVSVSAVCAIGVLALLTTIGARTIDPLLLYFGSLMPIDSLLLFAPYNFMQWLQTPLFGEGILYAVAPSVLFWIGLVWRRHDTGTSRSDTSENWKWIVIPFAAYLCLWVGLVGASTGLQAIRGHGLIFKYASYTRASHSSAQYMIPLKTGALLGHTPDGGSMYSIVGQDARNQYVDVRSTTGKGMPMEWITYRMATTPPNPTTLHVTKIQVMDQNIPYRIAKETTDPKIISSLMVSWHLNKQVNVPFSAVEHMYGVRLFSSDLPGIIYEITIDTAGKQGYIDQTQSYMGMMIPVQGLFMNWLN